MIEAKWLRRSEQMNLGRLFNKRDLTTSDTVFLTDKAIDEADLAIRLSNHRGGASGSSGGSQAGSPWVLALLDGCFDMHRGVLPGGGGLEGCGAEGGCSNSGGGGGIAIRFGSLRVGRGGGR